METVNLNPNTNIKAFAGLGTSKAEVQKNDVQTDKVNPAHKSEHSELNLRDPEDARFKALKEASQRVININMYPVSDVRFTIYKDKSDAGDLMYFTRFTSLRDGKVTVVPGNKVLSAAGKDSGTLLETLV